MHDVETYLRSGRRRVHGWLHPYSAQLIVDLATAQRKLGIEGGLGEIGVHMGKLFLCLHLSRAAGERTFAIDVFGDQQLNLDRSGSGDRQRFLQNVERWAGSLDDLTIIQRSSMEVDPAELLQSAGACRLVSIDGGHTEECTASDLRLVERILRPEGVAILDDCFNEKWPGVVSGLVSYLRDPQSVLRPFAISPNKLYLSRREHHQTYQAALTDTQQSASRKTDRLFAHDVLCLRPKPLSARIKRAMAETAAGPYARRLYYRATGRPFEGR